MEPVRHLDSLVAAGWGHSDVGHDDIRPLTLDRFRQPRKVVAQLDHLDVITRGEQRRNPLAHEKRIFPDDHPNDHPARLPTPITPAPLAALTGLTQEPRPGRS